MSSKPAGGGFALRVVRIGGILLYSFPFFFGYQKRVDIGGLKMIVNE